MCTDALLAKGFVAKMPGTNHFCRMNAVAVLRACSLRKIIRVVQPGGTVSGARAQKKLNGT
jgi:hypothetical protein